MHAGRTAGPSPDDMDTYIRSLQGRDQGPAVAQDARRTGAAHNDLSNVQRGMQHDAPAHNEGGGDLTALLSELGCTKYQGILEQEDVNVTDLAHLSKEDLRAIGVPMGPASRIVQYFKETF